jgi:putative endonuclease
VAEKDGCLVICEVKTRAGLDAGHPLEAVTAAKQARLRKLGDYYWQFETGRNQPLRFDVLAVLEPDGSHRIEHVIDAF